MKVFRKALAAILWVSIGLFMILLILHNPGLSV